MKRISLFVAGLLIMSSLVIIGTGNEAGNTQNLSITFSEPAIHVENDYLQINVEGTNNYNYVGGQPFLPKYTETIELEFGVKNVNIQYQIRQKETQNLEKTIQPAPAKTIQGFDDIPSEPLFDETIYDSQNVFPNDWYDYNIGVGLNENNEHKTFLTINVYPVRYRPALDTIEYISGIDFTITYDDPDNNPFTSSVEEKMLIIAPETFSDLLQELIQHKNNMGVNTYLTTVEDIVSDPTYNSYWDEPEMIKYYLKDQVEQNNVKYVLLVGGLKSLIYDNPRDTESSGVKDWYVPVRWTNIQSSSTDEPGYVSDLYYSDLFKANGEFDSWDSNNNHIYSEGGFAGDRMDLYPDVSLGRLACRNTDEVAAVVQKIITYEQNPADSSWFNKIIGISGDGFLDQFDLEIEWDTTGMPNGDYTLYAQSNNDEGEFGPIETTTFKIDKTVETKLTFRHTDYLLVPNFPSYPAPPIGSVMTVSDGDILGNTDYEYIPTESQAYINSYYHYADVRYIDNVLHIGAKTYDPKLYGNLTDIHVWIVNGNGDTVFDEWRNDSKMFSEGDWTVGEKLLHDRAGAFYYMPEDFQKQFLSTANGGLTGMDSVINAFSQGAGFVFFSGHGSPNVWANQYPGIPGNRQIGSVTGLKVVNFKLAPPFIVQPFLPMKEITNTNKLPVTVVGGCHNSMITVSVIPTFLNIILDNNMHTYGQPVPETFSWYMVKLPETGAIATIGNTGYGYGILGEWCTTGGVDNWITTEFFRQYGPEEGHDILGVAHSQTLKSYVDTFGKSDLSDIKTVQEWLLLGDPSLKMGGYPREANTPVVDIAKTFKSDHELELKATTEGKQPEYYEWKLDTTGDGIFDTTVTGDRVEATWENSGVYLVKVIAQYQDGEQSSYTVVNIENSIPNTPTIHGPTSGTTAKPSTYTIDGSDPDNEDLCYLVDWGDGSRAYLTPLTGNTITHKWKTPGNYQITIIACDDAGNLNAASTSITVSKGKSVSLQTPLHDFLSKLLEKFPDLGVLLEKLLELLYGN